MHAQTAAPDLPFLPCRSGLWNRCRQRLGDRYRPIHSQRSSSTRSFWSESANRKTHEQTNLTTSLNPSHLSTEHRGLRIVRVPVGPSAGTRSDWFWFKTVSCTDSILGIKAAARINLKGSRVPLRTCFWTKREGQKWSRGSWKRWRSDLDGSSEGSG